MKTRWIVGGLLLVVLLLLTLRERFTSYEEALRDVGQTSGQVAPTCPTGMTLNPNTKDIGKICEKKTATGSIENTAAECPMGYDLTKRGTNWTCVSKTPIPTAPAPATAPAAMSAPVSPTCPVGYSPSGGRGAMECLKTENGAVVDRKPPVCEGGRQYLNVGPFDLCVSASAVGAKMPSCPTGYNPTSPSEGEPMCKQGETKVPMVCESGFTFSMQEGVPLCIPAGSGVSAVLSSVGIGSSVPGSAGVGAVTGTGTGGTSGMAFGPTNQSKMLGQKVWGPASKGLGQASEGPVAGDSSKSTPYPVLLGGETGKSSTRIEGVGVVPSSFSGLSSMLPSSKVLGAEDSARFLPFSREPGDQELIPDPYRLAKNYSTSSYSMSKTDPVPFLTDFSAFYK